MSLAQECYGFRSELNAKGIVFSFVGYVSEGILFALGDALKQKMALEDTDANLTKRVFSVFVEQVQNIIRYSSDRVAGETDRPVEMSSGLIAVGREEGRFFVLCGNTINTAEAPRLRQKLEHLRSLDKQGIKAFYKEKLREPPEEDSKGASIGLIEIARRASEPLGFDFLDLPEGQCFFALKAYI
jgi:regulator of sigma D